MQSNESASDDKSNKSAPFWAIKSIKIHFVGNFMTYKSMRTTSLKKGLQKILSESIFR